MFARKLAYELMAAGPFIMLAMIGVHARTTSFDWNPVEYGPVQNQHVRAYIGPVRAVRALKADDIYEVQKTADDWIRLHDSGELKSVRTVYLQDLSQDSSVINQIVEAKMYLATVLNDWATYKQQRGEPKQSCELALQAYEVAAIGKYGFFDNVARSSALQEKALDVVASEGPKLSSTNRTVLIQQLKKASRTERDLNGILADARWAYFGMLKRQGVETSDGAVEGSFEKLAYLTSPNHTLGEASEAFKLCLTTSDTDLAYIALMARQAKMAESSLRDRIQQTTQLLAKQR